MDSETGITIDEMVQDLIISMNDLIKNMAAGQYIRVCSITVEMVSKMQAVRDRAKKDRQQLQAEIDELKARTNELAEIAFKGGT